MKIKGTAVRTIPDFVKARFKDRYKEWLDKLPTDSKKILSDTIIPTEWYPLTEGVIVPTEVLGEMIFRNAKEAAMALGKYSAEDALSGVYKVFVMIATPSFMMSRAASIFATYYRPSDIKLVVNKTDNAVFEIRKFEEKDILIAYRIAGWIEKALDIVHRENIRSTVSTRYQDSEFVITIDAKWEG